MSAEFLGGPMDGYRQQLAATPGAILFPTEVDGQPADAMYLRARSGASALYEYFGPPRPAPGSLAAQRAEVPERG